MVYRDRPHQVAYFGQHEWAETPSQMLHPLVVKTLENTRYFRAVLTPPYTGRYTYALRTEILELTQDFTSQPATLLLSMRLQLTDAAAAHVIATKEISLREPMQQKTPYAGVAAANEATAKALQEVAVFVLEKAD
jgi:cholesterol transport system auxiliary component